MDLCTLLLNRKKLVPFPQAIRLLKVVAHPKCDFTSLVYQPKSYNGPSDVYYESLFDPHGSSFC
jgi:hypothetical protein